MVAASIASHTRGDKVLLEGILERALSADSK